MEEGGDQSKGQPAVANPSPSNLQSQQNLHHFPSLSGQGYILPKKHYNLPTIKLKPLPSQIPPHRPSSPIPMPSLPLSPLPLASNFPLLAKPSLLIIILIRCMLSRLPQASPLRKRETTYNSFPSFQGCDQRHSEQKNEPIPSLITKFVHLSSQIQIQHNISSFNLIDYDKQDKGIYDDNLANAKLRRIENNVELKRANMQLFMRKRKMQRIKEQKHKEEFIREEINDSKNQYKNIFRTFAEGKNNHEEDNQSQEEEKEQAEAVLKFAPTADGILYFNELKKHPKLLNYTLEKVKAKNVKTQREKYQKRDRILKFRNEMRTVSHSEPRISLKDKTPTIQPLEYQPQVIFENIFRKIYTKKNHNKSISEARSDRRLNQFMSKQEQILQGVNEKSLSKQNYKKLKQRFDDLLNELYQVDKKHRIQQNNQKKGNQTMSFFRPRGQEL